VDRSLPPTEDRLDDQIAAIYRRMTPAQRLAIAVDANETARALLAAQIRRRQGELTAEQVQAEVARRMLGESA